MDPVPAGQRAPVAGHRAHLHRRRGKPEQALRRDRPGRRGAGRRVDGGDRRDRRLRLAGVVALAPQFLAADRLLRDHRRPGADGGHPAGDAGEDAFGPSGRRHHAAQRPCAAGGGRRVVAAGWRRVAARGAGLRRARDCRGAQPALHGSPARHLHRARHHQRGGGDRQPGAHGGEHQRRDQLQLRGACLCADLPGRPRPLAPVGRHPAARVPVGHQPVGVRGATRSAHHRGAYRRRSSGVGGSRVGPRCGAAGRARPVVLDGSAAGARRLDGGLADRAVGPAHRATLAAALAGRLQRRLPDAARPLLR